MKPALAMVSHVAPVPATAGQNQRVRFTLEALRRYFTVTFVTPESVVRSAPDFADLVDDLVAVPAPAGGALAGRVRAVGDLLAAASTGLKRSNRQIDRMLRPSALAEVLDAGAYELAFCHYWHAQGAVGHFQAAGVPVVLDMHDALWRARGTQLRERNAPEWWARRQEERYRRREEAAWARYDGVVAINAAEADEARAAVGADTPVWYAPMGVRLDQWRVEAAPATPPRIAYYGGLGSRARELAVLRCAHDIMPTVWAEAPDAEFWVVGSGPTEPVRRLGEEDGRITVTGFVDDPAAMLSTMTAVLCPFVGTFGFRSRLIEVLACGVPIVATPDAIHGMGLEPDSALVIADTDHGLAQECLALVAHPGAAADRAQAARLQADRFDFESTYGALAEALAAFVRESR